MFRRLRGNDIWAAAGHQTGYAQDWTATPFIKSGFDMFYQLTWTVQRLKLLAAVKDNFSRRSPQIESIRLSNKSLKLDGQVSVRFPAVPKNLSWGYLPVR